jgi:hypothetical protein
MAAFDDGGMAASPNRAATTGAGNPMRVRLLGRLPGHAGCVSVRPLCGGVSRPVRGSVQPCLADQGVPPPGPPLARRPAVPRRTQLVLRHRSRRARPADRGRRHRRARLGRRPARDPPLHPANGSGPPRGFRRDVHGSPGSASAVNFPLEVPGGVALVPALELGALPVTSVHDAAAATGAAGAGHLPVVVVEQSVVGGQLLAAATSRMVTRSVLPPKPTLGSQEWTDSSCSPRRRSPARSSCSWRRPRRWSLALTAERRGPEGPPGGDRAGPAGRRPASRAGLAQAGLVLPRAAVFAALLGPRRRRSSGRGGR